MSNDLRRAAEAPMTSAKAAYTGAARAALEGLPLAAALTAAALNEIEEARDQLRALGGVEE